MIPHDRDAWITGIGLVSNLGEGCDATWQGLMAGRPNIDEASFAPYPVHRLAAVDFSKQIPKAEQRLMDAWQRTGTYAAGLALESAGLKGSTAVLSHTDLVVVAGGGERDTALDCSVLTQSRTAPDRARLLNERLMSDLRPTLFLSQLSNMLAGNISIVHGVTGSSRTFLGEAAGIEAVRTARARVMSGQSDIVLVGGAHSGERKDLLLFCEAGGLALKGEYAPVFERQARGGGVALGSFGVFLVIESAIAPHASGGRLAVLSGASGAEPTTSEERAFFATLGETPVRVPGSYVGYGFEAQFSMSVAVAALAASNGTLFPAADRFAANGGGADVIDTVLVTGASHCRGEGLALVEKVHHA